MIQFESKYKVQISTDLIIGAWFIPNWIFKRYVVRPNTSVHLWNCSFDPIMSVLDSFQWISDPTIHSRCVWYSWDLPTLDCNLFNETDWHQSKVNTYPHNLGVYLPWHQTICVTTKINAFESISTWLIRHKDRSSASADFKFLQHM